MSEPVSAYVLRYMKNPASVQVSVVDPILLYHRLGGGAEESSEFRYRTVSAVELLPVSGEEPLVIPVRKSKDNAFQRGVTVGRTANNDVVLDDGSVSRFHAWFQRDATGPGWSLADAGSKNGTRVNGERLKSRKLVALKADAVIRFGQVEVRFLPPDAFVEFLKARVGNK
jgi:pSer/pThr/pTyr-binding forkhead associated (FHA) protein